MVGGYRIFTLVRAPAGRVGVRGMDRRSRGDQGQACQEEDRPRRCPTLAQVAAGKSFSSNLGARSGKSRSAATVVAPASVGADAHADHESTAGAGDERGLSLEEKTVQRAGTSAVREALVSSLGQSALARVVGAVGPHESDHCGVNRSCRAGSSEAPGGAATDDASWRGSAYGPRLRADHWNLGTFSTRQADRQLRGDDSE